MTTAIRTKLKIVRNFLTLRTTLTVIDELISAKVRIITKNRERQDRDEFYV